MEISTKSQIRNDIQIFRAFSIISVVLFHLNKDLVPFGYLGVDIFFVISGYLIFQQIYKNLNNKNFKLKVFYVKRIKRILPSLVSSSLFTIFIGYKVLSLEAFYELIRGIKYSLFFVGNVYFSRILDYFSIDSSQNLIVNLWSLSIEEQFYLLFPLVVMFIFKVNKKYIPHILLVFMIISFSSRDELFYDLFKLDRIFFHYDNYIFYSPITRAWQLLLGAVTTFNFLKLKKQNKYLNYLLIIFILVSFISNQAGYNQIVACFLLSFLLSNETTIKLSYVNKALIHVGNISYSIYLFHQPVFAAVRNVFIYKPSQSKIFYDLDNFLVGFIYITIVYAISLFNFYTIENRFRNSKNLTNQFKTIQVSTILLLIIVLSPSLITTNFVRNDIQLEPYNFKYSLKPGANYLLDNDGKYCIDKDLLKNACRYGQGNDEIIFLGDSIISSLVSGFLVEDLLSKYKIIEYTKSGCYPIYSVCQFQDNLNYQLEVEGLKSKKIIFGGDFNTDNTSIKNLEKTLMMLLDNKNEVFFIGQIPKPENDELMYYLINSEHIYHNNEDFYFKKLEMNKKFQSRFNQIQFNDYQLERFYFIDTFELFCKDKKCKYFENDKSLFIDGSHLSYFGSKIIAEHFISNYIYSKKDNKN